MTILTNKQAYNKRHKQPLNEPNNKKEISSKSKIPKKVLDEVYDRGSAAYKTNYKSVREKGTGKKGTNAPPSKKLSQGAWSMARIYSFVNKLEDPNKKLNHDKDLIKSIPKYKNRKISDL
jgi:hypothetical protein